MSPYKAREVGRSPTMLGLEDHVKEFGLYPKLSTEALKDFKQSDGMLRHEF